MRRAKRRCESLHVFSFQFSPPPLFPADGEMLLGGVLWGRGEGFPVGLELVLLYMTFCKSRAD